MGPSMTSQPVALVERLERRLLHRRQGVVCHPEPCTTACSVPVTKIVAPQRSR
jgi:hypothetical protein